MRILMLAWEYPPHIVGGMGRHVIDLSAGLAAHGIHIQVITPRLRGGPPIEQTAEGVHIWRVDIPAMAEYEYLSFVQEANLILEHIARSIADTEGPFDLIHTHDWLTAQAAIALKHAWRRPMLATIHATERGRQQGYLGTPHTDRINQIEWSLAYEAWHIITCSRFMAEQVQSYFQVPADKISTVPNGVLVRSSPFNSQLEQQEYRRHFLPDNAPMLFYVGRMVYEKGVHVLIDSWPLVLAQEPHAHLVVAGVGNQLEAVRQRARDLGISDHITFAGFISDDDRERLYRVANCAAFPSLYEPFGIVALEAMAAGCPVVVTASGGLAEVVRLHETGITVYPHNPESLAWGILHTIQHPEWSQLRAAQALHEVRDRYNWHLIAADTKAIYQRILLEWRNDSWGAELVPVAG